MRKAARPLQQAEPCPCGGLPAGQTYARCCGKFHTGERPLTEATPEALMRSRYSAYVKQLRDYLVQTWDAATCPSDIDFAAPQPKWLGLTIHSAQQRDDCHAEVSFTARYKENGRALKLQERSRFVRASVCDAWRYVDGDLS